MLLERLMRDVDPAGLVRLNLSVEPDQAVLDAWLADGAEGVVVKRLSSTYRSGKRDRGWLKIKPTKSIDCVIVGVPRDGAGKYKGQVGAVQFDIGNGKTGRASGMTDAVRMDMTVNPDKYVGRMAEFAYQLMTRDGHLRHPQFVRMRPDRDPA
jgi:ATP-dependent DNA ligase